MNTIDKIDTIIESMARPSSIGHKFKNFDTEKHRVKWQDSRGNWYSALIRDPIKSDIRYGVSYDVREYTSPLAKSGMAQPVKAEKGKSFVSNVQGLKRSIDLITRPPAPPAQNIEIVDLYTNKVVKKLN